MLLNTCVCEGRTLKDSNLNGRSAVRLNDVLLPATNANVSARIIGSASGDRLVAHAAFDVAVADAADTWRNAIPRLMQA